MDCSPPGSSVHGVLQARLLEWIVMPSSKGSSQPSDQTRVSYVSWISGGFFTTNATWEALGRFHNVLLSFIVSLISFIQGKTVHNQWTTLLRDFEQEWVLQSVRSGNVEMEWLTGVAYLISYFKRSRNKEITLQSRVGWAFGVGWLDTLCFWTFSGTGNLGLLMSEG